MLLLTLFAAFLPATFAVKCYICSYSPKDAGNKTLICTEEHFEANAVAISDCENGCEIYSHWDSNGVLEQVRRNCLQPDTELTGDCKKEENVIHSSKRCTCNYNLCNSASSLSISILVPASICAAFLYLRHLYSI